jgi:hypothetical protein
MVFNVCINSMLYVLVNHIFFLSIRLELVAGSFENIIRILVTLTIRTIISLATFLHL